MAKITEIFKLKETQFELDFINIDTDIDTPVFIDPYWISKQDCEFTIICDQLIKNFFTKLINLIKNNKMREAIQICRFLNENSDVCLGFSKTRGTKGSGIGSKIAYKFCYELKSCEALKKDIITSIEDVKIFIEDLDVDRISDMVSNIIRLPLLQYTKTQCENYNIPLQKLQTKPFWNGKTNQWERYNDFPQLIVNGERKLLVPKKLVSDSNNFTWFNFLQHYIYNSLIDKNLKEDSSLVMERKDGTKYVTKKSIKEDLEKKEFVLDKKFCERFAIENPDLYSLFKEEIINKYNVSIEDDNLSKSEVAGRLIDELKSVNPGKADDSKYEDVIFKLLIFIFGDNVTCTNKETKIHDGRKRIDITFLNASNKGVFFDLDNLYKIPAQLIICECKNYSTDISNAEVDQMSGRFSPRRGKFGILAYRKVNNKELIIKRCQDTYSDDRGLVIPIDDSDLIMILSGIAQGKNIFDDYIKSAIYEIIKN